MISKVSTNFTHTYTKASVTQLLSSLAFKKHQVLYITVFNVSLN